jgi:two-component system chemotaxis sensor kinase CheA
VSKSKKAPTSEKKSHKQTKTRRQRVQEKDLLINLLEVIPDSIYFKDIESRFIIGSKYLVKDKLGMDTMDEIIGKTDFDFFSEEHARQAFEDEQKIIHSGEPIIGIEEKETWPDRPDAWVTTTKMPLQDSKKNIIGTFGISRDITERKEAEIQLLRYKEYLEKAKQETDNILQNVEEGLFLLDSNFKIGSHYSRALTKILGDNHLAGRELVRVLANKVDKSVIGPTNRYLRLMFKKEVSEDMLYDLNPLSKIMVNIADKNNIWSSSKHLAFKFRRIIDKGGEVNHLIVTVTDLTEEVNLSNQLVENEEKSQRQMTYLMSVLHVEPAMLQEFLGGAELELNELDQLIQEYGMDGDYRDLLENLFRSIHLIKGNAMLLDLKPFVEHTHDFEEKIVAVQKRDSVSGSDFVPLVLNLRELKKNLQELQELLHQLSRLREHLSDDQGASATPILVRSLDNLVKRLSESMGKQVSLNHSKFDENAIPYSKRLVIRDVLVQFARNSMCHGIEVPQERESLGKPPAGLITLSTQVDGKNIKVVFRDDGRGLPLEALRAKLRDSGRWKPAELNSWKEEELAEAIFLPGISTAGSTTVAGGRGIGLDVVKKKIESHQGSISVRFITDQYCEFIVSLPLPESREKKRTRAPRKRAKKSKSVYIS